MGKSHMFILTYFWRENSNKCKLAMLKMRLFRNFITLWKGLKMKEVVEMHKSKFEHSLKFYFFFFLKFYNRILIIKVWRRNFFAQVF